MVWVKGLLKFERELSRQRGENRPISIDKNTCSDYDIENLFKRTEGARMSVTLNPQVNKQARPVEYDVADDEKVYSTRRPSSARKYQQPKQQDALDDPPGPQTPIIPRRRSSGGLNTSSSPAAKTSALPVTGTVQRPKRFPFMAVLGGMSVAIILVVSLSVVGSWWRVYQDDLHYGRPRTFQFDAVVGHGDSSSNPTHFILINLNRHVEIFELPGGDGAHARVYMGPTLFGDGQDLTPIIGEVRDVNGDGKPDLIIHIQDQTIVYINDGSAFRPAQPGDHVRL